MPNNQKYGRELADEWEEQVETMTDSAHDLAEAAIEGEVDLSSPGAVDELVAGFLAQIETNLRRLVSEAQDDVKVWSGK
jgi:hypothetical protein